MVGVPGHPQLPFTTEMSLLFLLIMHVKLANYKDSKFKNGKMKSVFVNVSPYSYPSVKHSIDQCRYRRNFCAYKYTYVYGIYLCKWDHTMHTVERPTFSKFYMSYTSISNIQNYLSFLNDCTAFYIIDSP